MIKVAILGFWHVHGKDYAKQAREHPETNIVAVWDDMRERGREKAIELGVPFCESLDDIWRLPQLDGVIVTAATNKRNEVVMAAVHHGKHVFTEKMLIPPLAEIELILDAVKENNVKLTFALTRLYHGYAVAIADIIQRQWLGRLTFARVRASHRGGVVNSLPAWFYSLEQSVGGVMIDLGAHPVYLMRMIMGMPDSVTAHFGHVMDRETEDNAVAVMTYSDGAIGIAETTIVCKNAPPISIEIHGTGGSMYYGFADGKLLVKSAKTPAGEKVWMELPVPDHPDTPFQQWVGHIRDNTVATNNIQTSVDTAKLMEGAYISAQENRTVHFFARR
jgi:predicted dehydrogenase